MCCRVVIDITKETRELLIKDLNLGDTFQIPLSTSYNCAPGQLLPIVHKDSAIIMENMMWGYLPYWSENKILPNARIESVSSKRTFKQSYEKRRCLLPVKGFYEWQGAGANKTPYFFYAKEGEMLALGCIYEQSDDENEKDRFTVITTEAIPPFSDVHDRMPLIISQQYWEKWIDCREELDRDPLSLSINYVKELTYHQVSKEVNKTSNDNKSLIDRFEDNTLF